MEEIHSYTLVSWSHIVSALLAMVLGAVMLIMPKGTARHKRIGYAYVASMLLLNATAFAMYRLFGGFGPFHGAAVISLLTVGAGVWSILRRGRGPDRVVAHLIFMYWSVIGLYAAFFSEIMVHLHLRGTFMVLVSCATAGVVLVGALAQGPLVKRWTAELRAKEL